MKHCITVFLCVAFATAACWAQQSGSYRSKQNGIWNQSTTWEKFNGTAWVEAVSPDIPNNQSLDVTIQSNHTVTVTTTAPAPPYLMRNLTVESNAKLFTNANVVTPRYLMIYGNVHCDGIIGNYPIPDDIGLSIEGSACVISGSSSPESFAISRLRKGQSSIPTATTTNLTINRSFYTTYNHATYGNTQILNNRASTFNIVVSQGATVNCSGSVSIDGNVGADGTNLRGSITVHGVMNIDGTLYLRTNNTGSQPNSFTIGTTGIVNANTLNADTSKGNTTTAGHVFTIHGNGTTGGRLNILGDAAFVAFSTVGNTYILQAGSTVAYAASAGSQTVRPLPYSRLEINNQHGVTIQQDISVSMQLAINGLVNTGNNVLHLTSTNPASIIGYNETAYVNGHLRRNVFTGNTYDFPVGSATHYQPAFITLNDASGLTHLTASFTSGLPNELPDPAVTKVNGTPITDMLNAGYWTLEPNAYTSIDYNITLSQRGWNNFTGVPAQLAVIKRENNATPWWGTNAAGGPDGLQGTHENSTQTIQNNIAAATRFNLKTLSDFGIGFGNVALPVQLTQFNAEPLSDAVRLTWETESEWNNERFDVQRSADGFNFGSIGSVMGNGTTDEPHAYEFIDTRPLPSNNYYRLAQIDQDGAIEHSQIRLVKFRPSIVNELLVYPSPVSEILLVDGISSASRIEITDAHGKVLIRANAEEDNMQRVDVTSLTPGLYWLIVTSDKETRTKAFQVAR